MAKMKIEVRKPQYIAHKQKTVPQPRGGASVRTPFFFRLLLLGTYAFSFVALWFVFQRIRVV